MPINFTFNGKHSFVGQKKPYHNSSKDDLIRLAKAGYTQKEAAEELGLTPNAVGKRAQYWGVSFVTKP